MAKLSLVLVLHSAKQLALFFFPLKLGNDLYSKAACATDGLYHILPVSQKLVSPLYMIDRLCGLVVRVSGYRYRGPGFDSRRYQIF